MNEYQQHALRVLAELTTSKNDRNTRGVVLLCRLTPLEAYRRIPEDEFCRGWAFCVGPHFAEALDCQLQSRKRNKKSYSVWTQGSAFSFKQGYTIHRADGGMIVQVLKAKEAIPGRKTIKRDSGYITAQCFAPNSGETIWKKDAIINMTHDEFVRFLITGSVNA